MSSASRFRAAVLAVLAFASFGQARADVTQADEYLRRLKIYQTVQPIGPAPFGEQVNLYTGELTFSQTDISLEGTGPTISLVRDLPSFQSKDLVHRPYLLGDWLLSIPRIETITHAPIGTPPPPGQNWVMGPAGDPNRYSRCTALDQPYSPQGLDSIWWNGIELVTETGQRQPILHRTVEYPQQPSLSLQGSPVVFTGVTLQNWQVGCLPNTSNGELGEAFLAVSPDGTKYWFDYLTDESIDTLYEFSLDGTLLKQRRRLATMYVSKIEDRFGNWVQYQYSGDKPIAITASDGRSVAIQWRADARLIDQIVVQPGAGQRVWRYEYSAISTNKATLSAVVLPDNTRWSFDLQGLVTKPPAIDELDDCGVRSLSNDPSGVTSTLTHPSGLIGRYTVAVTWHARSYVPSSCVYPQVGQEFVPYESNFPLFGTRSLTRKELSGPGLSTQAWTYGYAPAVGSTTQDACASAGTCAATTWVDVVDPKGDRTRYVHSNRWNETEAKLLSTEVYQGASTLIRSESVGYAASNLGPYPSRIGWAMTAPYSNFVKDEVWTPANQRTISQQGATFTWQANNFDGYANPLSITRSSTLGYSRTDVAAYHHNTALWVIGQAASSTNSNTGLVESQTDYDANAMPWKTFAFGKLQQTLLYDTTSAASTGQRGTLKTATDGNNRTTTFGSWKRGIPQTIIFADTTTKSAQVNDLGQIDWVKNEVGAKTCYGYDAMGRVTSITQPSEVQAGVCNQDNWLATTIAFAPSAEAKYGLPANHWRRTEATGNARKITFYDALWRPMVQETYDLADTGNTLSQSVTRYDANGQVVYASYPQRNMLPSVYNTWADPAQIPNALGTWTTYDALGRATQVQQNSEHGLLTTTTEYLSGFQTRYTDARGQQTTTRYLAYDQPTTDWVRVIHHPEGAYTYIERDVFGKPWHLARTNADLSQWSGRYYAYDSHQRLCKQTDLETGTTAFGYDEAGNQIWSAVGLPWSPYAPCEYAPTHASVAPKRVDRTYDARNRLKTLSFPDSRGNQVWTYTPDGLPDSVTTYNEPNQGTPVVTAYHYNQRRMLDGQGETNTQPGWYTWGIGYGYDSLGNLARQGYPTGLMVDFAPNALGQATQVSSTGQIYASNIQYHANGGIQQFTYGNGIIHTMTQNARQLPLTSTDSGGVLSQEYGYDNNGNVSHILDSNRGPNYNRWLGYDGLDRLIAAGSCSFGPGCWFYYSYDALDNLTRVQSPGGVDHYYCYDTRWQLTNLKTGPCTSGASVVGLGYDERGNLNNKNGQTYDFDYGNRLRAVAGQETYRYDGLGRRVLSYRAPGQYTLAAYTQAGQRIYDQYAEQTRVNEYVYLAGSLLATRSLNWVTNATTIRYQHTDALGTPVAETDTTGTVVQRSEYDPYGRLNNRPLTDGPGYTGHYQDAATGMTYMQQRYYDPQIGRFLSMDPVTANANTGANFNRYWYANNNPYKFTDPDGRQSKAAGKNIGRWARALWDNNGDFEKAQAQVERQQQMDLKTANAIVDMTSVGTAKDAVEITAKLANGEKPLGQATGSVAGDVAAEITEHYLDGKIGDGPASAAGAAAGKIVGDVVESRIDRAMTPSSSAIKPAEPPPPPPPPPPPRPENDIDRRPL